MAPRRGHPAAGRLPNGNKPFLRPRERGAQQLVAPEHLGRNTPGAGAVHAALDRARNAPPRRTHEAQCREKAGSKASVPPACAGG
eukprot:1390366-Alexandrium_andersonii.AAC.1